MLDTDDRKQRIVLAGRGDVPDESQYDVPGCSVNGPLFRNVTGQNGGPTNMGRVNEILIDGQLLDVFCRIAEGMEITADSKHSKEMRLFVDKRLHGQMDRMRRHLRLSRLPVSFTMDQCTFVMGWLGRFFMLENIDDVRMLMLYRDNAAPVNFHGVLGALGAFERRILLHGQSSSNSGDIQ